MHRIYFILQVLLLALAAGAQELFELACLESDLLEDSDYNISTCLQKPYCPGYEVSDDVQRYLFTQFTQTLYGEKNVSKAFETYVSSNITEHDPDDAPNNRDAIVARLSQIIPYANFTILRSSFDNDTGLIHLRFEQNPEPVALADIYRMDGTCIVEHWDVSQTRPANSTNPIAMF